MPSHIQSSIVSYASTLIEQRTGLAASTQFRADLESILYNLSQGDIEGCVAQLEKSHETGTLWQMLINALTIGETYFFRDPAHFKLLRNHILPALVLARRQQGQFNLNVWSVGCATGEEPYSIAISLHEFIPDLARWTPHLIGTDINNYALDAARRGVYRRWAFRQPPASETNFQQRYFDPHENGLQLKSFIRDLVNFRQMNLLNGTPLPQCDIIFCRNVLIYFKNNQVELVEDLLFNTLSPGGWLILGQSEAVRFKRERWLTHLFPGTAVYQKPLESKPRSLAYQKHSQPALEIVATATEEVPAVKVATYEDAVCALQKEDSETTERLLNEILTYQPDNASAHTLLATLLANRHALPEARAHIDIALRIDPLRADAHYLRAILFIEEGQNQEARKSLSAAIYCQRNHPLASFMLGNLYAQAGDITRANHAWENALRAISSLKPESPISDISDITAGRLHTLIAKQLDGWKS